MSPERWARIKEIFETAVELESTAREEFLTHACGDDDGLREEVESLLAFDGGVPAVLEVPVAEVIETLLPPAAEGRRFGPYRAVAEIGRGGMAVVYAAVRADDQFEKRVALKLIKRGMDTDAIVARFLVERQILARLEHPAIARLLDGGVSEDGLPFLVMEHVEGEPIDVFCARRGLGVAARLELFQQVAAAVHFAHRNLVVHRDLKPSNILVETDGRPRLLDFGIAKLLDPAGSAPTMTAFGLRPMTPEVASPEQLRGGPITTATDVYSLGVLLYQLLTGRRPYTLDGLGPGEVERIVCALDPLPPSTAVDQRRGEPAPGRPPDATPRRLRGDLDTVVAKALHKDPERRYGSAEQLAEDLHRHLAGQPVGARGDTLAYRAGKFLGRHRVGVAAALLLVLSLAGGVLATARQARVARAERATAEWVSGFLVELFEISHPGKARGETVTARQLLDAGARRIAGGLEVEPAVRAALMDDIGLAYTKLGLYEQAEPLLVRGLELRLEHQGAGDAKTAVSRNHLGELRTAQGRYAEAETLHRAALAAAEGRHEEALEAEARDGLALALFYQGQAEPAERLLRENLELRRRLQGEGHEEVAGTLNNLALVVKTLGRYAEAETLYAQTLELGRRLFGDDHPAVAVALNNLAEALRAQGQCARASGLYREALAIERVQLGAEHPDLADPLDNLARCLLEQGELTEAEELFGRALELRRRAHGAEHPKIAAALDGLARVHQQRGELARAEALEREALALARRLLGPEHPEVATLLGNLAIVLTLGGNLAEAESASREALELHRRLRGAEHPEVATDRHNLAELLRRQGRFAEAAVEYRAALETRRRLLGAAHPHVAESLFGLGLSLTQAGEPAAAEPVLREGLERWQRWPEEQWRRVAATRELLGTALLELGRPAEAEPLLLASLGAYRERGDLARAQRVETKLVALRDPPSSKTAQ